MYLCRVPDAPLHLEFRSDLEQLMFHRTITEPNIPSISYLKRTLTVPLYCFSVFTPVSSWFASFKSSNDLEGQSTTLLEQHEERWREPGQICILLQTVSCECPDWSILIDCSTHLEQSVAWANKTIDACGTANRPTKESDTAQVWLTGSKSHTRVHQHEPLKSTCLCCKSKPYLPVWVHAGRFTFDECS